VKEHPKAVARIWGQDSLGDQAATEEQQRPAQRVDAGKVDQLRQLIRRR
jgi:hypothetical protein